MVKAKTPSQIERDGLTLTELASMMDLTKDRIRQIEARALMKLRANLTCKRISPTELFGGMQ